MTMKAMIDGVWHAAVEDSAALRTRRVAEKEQWFRNRVEVDPDARYPAAAGRYHLYVSYACPWAHKTILYRKLMGLEQAVSMSVVGPRWGGPNGWTFGDGDDPAAGTTRDHVNGTAFLYEVYRLAKPDVTGKVTVPVLFDRDSRTIVSNESADILRMFADSFGAVVEPATSFRPARLVPAIDALNDFVIDRIANGVYRTGFANTQADYDRSIGVLFDALDEIEIRLADRPYLFGDVVTETDWHLFVVLVRFDAVYHSALRCNLRRLIEYPNLWAYTRRLHGLPGVAETVRIDHIKRHYYDDLGLINPTIVAAGPMLDFASDRSIGTAA